MVLKAAERSSIIKKPAWLLSRASSSGWFHSKDCFLFAFHLNNKLCNDKQNQLVGFLGHYCKSVDVPSDLKC